jgi:N-acetyl-anhydromuramyl-L-alanine amidase AmpD
MRNPIAVLKNWLASRPRKEPITTIVLHATAGSSLSGALSALRQKELSYHYLIEKSGRVTKCVPYGKVAFHAGVSKGPSGENCNRYSIGISFVNLNDGKDPYTQAQIEECRFLIEDLWRSVPSLEYLTTHYAVAPKRKTDPKSFPCSLVVGRTNLKLWGCK